MFCPVDGDEFVEGLTRCPEHDCRIEPPTDTFITLLSVNEVARAGTYASFAAMAALWMVGRYSQPDKRASNEGNSESDVIVGQDESG